MGKVSVTVGVGHVRTVVYVGEDLEFDCNDVFATLAERKVLAAFREIYREWKDYAEEDES
jgi:hypothetical protein